MNVTLKPIVLILVLTLLNCKNTNSEKTLENYNYSNKGIVVNCDNFDLKLLNEALFSFEDDILKYFKENRPETNINSAYSQFINNVIYGRAAFVDIASPHTIKIFEVLKSKKNLWRPTNNTSKLNYDSNLVTCITENINNTALKTTLEALLSTNSMSPKLFGPAIQSNYGAAISDKYISTYIAFDFFYAKLFDVDVSLVVEKPDPKVDFNALPEKPISTNN